MHLGVPLPEQDIGVVAGPTRDFVQECEALGYEFVTVGDHVLGADTTNRPGWTGLYDRHVPWHDALVALGYLAGITKRMELFACVVVLPQRQTAVVAKQAAEVDILSEGRLRLGIGAGWNQVEFEALDQDFQTRGQRIEEQIAVLRALWTQEVVTFHGRWHHIVEAGLNPLPVQRPIPIWMGGGADPVLRRVGRLADGWFPDAVNHGEAWVPGALQKVRRYAQEAGRNPADIRVHASVNIMTGTPESWLAAAEHWQGVGVTHLSVSTRRSGVAKVEDHLRALRLFRETVTPVLAAHAC